MSLNLFLILIICNCFSPQQVDTGDITIQLFLADDTRSMIFIRGGVIFMRGGVQNNQTAQCGSVS